ncbi:MAG: peptidylprolyl isomerase [Armatimonadetes bacterium]|nr:peptidylprolyl isomerase [Armatimonadota bacterium]
MTAALLALALAGPSTLDAPIMSEQDTTPHAATGAPGAPMPVKGEEVAVLTTDKGTVVLKFYPNVAPEHVKSFKKLVSEKFYDGTRFHRCIAGFMVQGGDPNSKDMAKSSVWGTGGPGFHLKAEFNDVKHTRGVLSMARSSDPDSAGSQFFIMVKEAPSLDHKYTAFGIVVEGMPAVDEIVKTGDAGNNGKVEPEDAVKIVKAEIKTWPIER